MSLIEDVDRKLYGHKTADLEGQRVTVLRCLGIDTVGDGDDAFRSGTFTCRIGDSAVEERWRATGIMLAQLEHHFKHSAEPITGIVQKERRKRGFRWVFAEVPVQSPLASSIARPSSKDEGAVEIARLEDDREAVAHELAF